MLLLSLLLGDGRDEEILSHRLTLKLDVARDGMNRSEVPTSEMDELDDLLMYDRRGVSKEMLLPLDPRRIPDEAAEKK